MNYSPADVERIYRMAITNVEWAYERAERLWDGHTHDNLESALSYMDEALYELEIARDKFRAAQLNKEQNA